MASYGQRQRKHGTIGHPRPLNSGRRLVQSRIPSDLADDVERMAERLNTSISRLVAEALARMPRDPATGLPTWASEIIPLDEQPEAIQKALAELSA